MRPSNLKRDAQKHQLECCFCGQRGSLMLVPLISSGILFGWLIACENHEGAIANSELSIDTRPSEKEGGVHELGPADVETVEHETEEEAEEDLEEADSEPELEPDDEAPF